MAVYTGSQGIASLREKIKLKSKMLVGESSEKITTHMVDESPLGVEVYPSLKGKVYNDVGDFKNSWSVGLGAVDPTVRSADTEGMGAVLDAIHKNKSYNLEDVTYVTNSIDHAKMVEDGWDDNPEYGWKAKGGYHVVGNNVGSAVAILEAVAQKLSKL